MLRSIYGSSDLETLTQVHGKKPVNIVECQFFVEILGLKNRIKPIRHLFRDAGHLDRVLNVDFKWWLVASV